MTAKEAKFGAFKGVFSPSILTILGVIMYLRFGWVVGEGGLIGAIAVVILAHVISITTGLSISSIATNRTVKTGGDYYMISRSLGLPIGGALGIALFFALALSMSLYLLGFAESFLNTFGFDNTLLGRRVVGTIAAIGLTIVTFISTSLALRIQYFVLAAIALSIISLFLSPLESKPLSEIPLWFSEGSQSFETVFAVFFPAVTGFTAGVAMSGDLKDPRRAIPKGTLAAILVGLIVYLAIPILLAGKVDRATLSGDPAVWNKVALFAPFVIAGVFAATLSSALGSILGAPRYLQALALDGVLPRFLGRGFGELNEPRIGTVVTFIIAEAGILIGELDVIARVITMFFLTSYGFLSLSCGMRTWSGISSFRPDFKTPAWVSFVGAITCLAVMFKLDAAAMAAATIVMGLIYFVLTQKQFRSHPKDNWRGFWAAIVQKGVLKIHRQSEDGENWRPNVLIFGGPPDKRRHLIEIAKDIVDKRGLCTYIFLIEGDLLDQAEEARKLEPTTRSIVSDVYPDALTRVLVCQNVYSGVVGAAQSYGLPGMTPNTALLGFPGETHNTDEATDLLKKLIALDHNVLLLKHNDTHHFGERKSIHIWWRGQGWGGELMLLLSFLLKSSDAWGKAQIQINVAVDTEDEKVQADGALRRILKNSHIEATDKVIVRKDSSKSIKQIITEESQPADLVIMGLREPTPEESGPYIEQLREFTEGLNTVLFVRASSSFDGAEVLFDS